MRTGRLLVVLSLHGEQETNGQPSGEHEMAQITKSDALTLMIEAGFNFCLRIPVCDKPDQSGYEKWKAALDQTYASCMRWSALTGPDDDEIIRFG